MFAAKGSLRSLLMDFEQREKIPSLTTSAAAQRSRGAESDNVTTTTARPLTPLVAYYPSSKDPGSSSLSTTTSSLSSIDSFSSQRSITIIPEEEQGEDAATALRDSKTGMEAMFDSGNPW